MWIKSVPHCTFSDFQNKANGTNFRKPEAVKKEFSDIPNYHLTSRAFDVRHLDKFLVRINESVNLSSAAESSVEGKLQLQLQDSTNNGIEDDG